MSLQIIPFKSGINTSYIIKNKGAVLFDGAPFVLKPSLPIYAKNIEQLKKSWKKVVRLGAKTIYPGHGKSFPVEKILKYLN